MFHAFSIILLIAALFSFINYKWIKLPSTIGVMLLALVSAVLIIVSEYIIPNVYDFFCGLVESANFKTLLLDVMLSILLFAGALHVDIQELKHERWSVLLFTTFGVLLSTFIIGGLMFVLLPLIGPQIPFIHALLFGALISPTDPIAVLAILEKSPVSKSLKLKIEGESLFNDGVGVVLFTVILLLAEGKAMEEGSMVFHVLELFLKEVAGGIVFGLLLGFGGYLLIKSVEDNPRLAIMLTLAIALGGYAIAAALHFSAPLTMVVAGIIIGNRICFSTFNSKSKVQINELWEAFDETLNGVLFVMIGLAVHLLEIHTAYLWGALIAVFVVLLGRSFAIVAPFSLLRHQKEPFWKTSGVLVWGGLRGGISLALALSVPAAYSGNLLVAITYGVVLFSILVQGLSIGKLVKLLFPQKNA